MTRDELAARAYELFKAELDTTEIAAEMGIKQAEASTFVWLGRCQAKGLPAEYLGARGAVLEASFELKQSA